MLRGALLTLALLGATTVAAEQTGDAEFRPADLPPRWPAGEGPIAAIDGAHHNFHTVDGRYQPFAAVLTADGFRVRGNDAPFTAESLAGVDLLVVANALNSRNTEDWSLPTPSAFTDGEIAVVRAWVEAGGGLFLIADHMPFPGAAAGLAAAFGFTLLNGFAVMEDDPGAPLVFTREAESLGDHPVTEGVETVASFTGEAFHVPSGATVLLVLPDGAVSLEPAEAWRFDEDTPRRDASGLAQGAVLAVGKGRVAVFGEAAMFTSQVSGERLVGLRSPEAKDNEILLRNLARWVAGG